MNMQKQIDELSHISSNAKHTTDNLTKRVTHITVLLSMLQDASLIHMTPSAE